MEGWKSLGLMDGLKWAETDWCYLLATLHKVLDQPTAQHADPFIFRSLLLKVIIVTPALSKYLVQPTFCFLSVVLALQTCMSSVFTSRIFSLQRSQCPSVCVF